MFVSFSVEWRRRWLKGRSLFWISLHAPAQTTTRALRTRTPTMTRFQQRQSLVLRQFRAANPAYRQCQAVQLPWRKSIFRGAPMACPFLIHCILCWTLRCLSWSLRLSLRFILRAVELVASLESGYNLQLVCACSRRTELSRIGLWKGVV